MPEFEGAPSSYPSRPTIIIIMIKNSISIINIICIVLLVFLLFLYDGGLEVESCQFCHFLRIGVPGCPGTQELQESKPEEMRIRFVV